MIQTQNKMILKHLKQYGKINPKQAYDKYSCMRLSARIFDLRGDDIHNTFALHANMNVKIKGTHHYP